MSVRSAEEQMSDVRRQTSAAYDDCACAEGDARPSGTIGRAPIGGAIVLHEAAAPPGHVIEPGGLSFVGTHVVLDMWQASFLDDAAVVQRTLRKAAAAAGATLLEIALQTVQPGGGITGVAVFAGSHIAVHTWPERSYAAVDIFMCGAAEPHEAVAVIRQAFSPEVVTISQHKRGVST
jgi:S-adenosylmethionine decarboxylase